MSHPVFNSASALADLINAYFNAADGEYHLEQKPGKDGKEAEAIIRVYDREPELATFAGLSLHLGFNSRQAFDDYELNGEYAETLKWGRLRIEALYEKKLHAQSSAGAIFALKSMGWNERREGKPAGPLSATINIMVNETGPAPAASEKDVKL